MFESCLSLIAAAMFAAPPPAPGTFHAPSRESSTSSTVYAAFVGSWKGTLEYRDYSSDKRVTLPTLLDVSIAPDGTAMVFRYVYDDGPGKTVRETDTISIDPTASTWTIASTDSDRRDTYAVEGLQKLMRAGQGTITLTSRGEDNGRKAEIRNRISVTATSYTLLKEIRYEGGEFLFRHQYSFTRVPAAG